MKFGKPWTVFLAGIIGRAVTGQVYDFESGSLVDWTGTNEGVHNGIVVNDPDPNFSSHNKVLTFNARNSAGDIFSKVAVPPGSKVLFRLFVKDVTPCSGACLGFSVGYPGSHGWPFCEHSSYPGYFNQDESREDKWLVCTVDNSASTPRHIMMEDFSGCSGAGSAPPPDVFFDDITVLPQNSPLNFPGCVPDSDKDNVPDAHDNCPNMYNPSQDDLDSDVVGDACDDDLDGDGITNDVDNCPNMYNPSQDDLDSDFVGDACDDDLDGDGIPNDVDNCPNVYNPNQKNRDGDSMGNKCDPDDDNDGVPDAQDEKPRNPRFCYDLDGDSCDDCSQQLGYPDHLNDGPDADGDGICDAGDNCPDFANPDQEDLDEDGNGDACECSDCREGTFGPCKHTNLGDNTCHGFIILGSGDIACPDGTAPCDGQGYTGGALDPDNDPTPCTNTCHIGWCPDASNGCECTPYPLWQSGCPK